MIDAIRRIVTIALTTGTLLLTSCESAPAEEDRGAAAAATASATTASALELGAGGEVQLSSEEVERLIEALEREISAASRSQ